MGHKSKILGYVEGTSTLALMGIAMPLKYIGGNEILVKILGPIHGLLFMLYLGVLFFGVENFGQEMLLQSDFLPQCYREDRSGLKINLAKEMVD